MSNSITENTGNIAKNIRLKYHAEWLSEDKPLKPVEGLRKELKETSRTGTSLLFLGITFGLVSAMGFIGDEMLPLENDWMLPVLTLLTGVFFIAGFALKLSKKDIEYMVEAEEEINRLQMRLDKHEPKDQGGKISYPVKSDKAPESSVSEKTEKSSENNTGSSAAQKDAYAGRYGVVIDSENSEISANKKSPDA